MKQKHKLYLISIIVLHISSILFAQNALLIEHNGEPGQLEETIMNDGDQHDVYILQADKVYLQRTQIHIEDRHIAIIGEVPLEGQHPATIQPIANDDGSSGFSGWPTVNIEASGVGTEVVLRNLLLNGASYDGAVTIGGAVTARGTEEKIVIDRCVLSNYEHLYMSTFGEYTDFHFTNSVAKSNSSYPGAQFWGGLLWGGGSWMGTMDTVIIHNSSIMNMVGEGVVIFSQVKYGLIDQCTFANITASAVWYKGQNNLTVKNNLFLNTKAHGQSQFDIDNWGIWKPGGNGTMSIMTQPEIYTDDYGYSLDEFNQPVQDGYDPLNRNINWHHNVWWNQEALTNFMQIDPWQWDGVDSEGNTITYNDAMLPLEDQNKWLDDSTELVINSGVGVDEWNNINSDPLINLSGAYLDRQLERTWDFRENGGQMDYEPFTTKWWQYNNDGDPYNEEWPLHEDWSYDPNSDAATANENGGPVGAGPFGFSHFSHSDIVNNFDADDDGNYWNDDQVISYSSDPDYAYVNINHVTDNSWEGPGSVELQYSVHNTESWGGFTRIGHRHPDLNGLYDWSEFDTLSFAYYINESASIPERVHVRFNLLEHGALLDGESLDDQQLGELYYSFHYILDEEPGWNHVKIPLENNYSWDGAGFNLTGWAGQSHNGELDLNAIGGFHIEFSISGAGEGDYAGGVILMDEITLIEAETMPVDVSFNFDLSIQPVSENGVHIVGTFNGWDPAGTEMLDEDGDGVYSYTASLMPGDSVFYKFINGNDWGAPHDVVLDPACGGGGFYGDRVLVVPDQPQVLDPVCMNLCSSCEDAQAAYLYKPGNADWNDPEYQDYITDNVIITRGNNKPIFNYAVESWENLETGCSVPYPSGTEWASVATSDVSPGEYTTFINMAQCYPLEYLIGSRKSMKISGGGANGEDLYFDVQFYNWGTGQEGASVQYMRWPADPPSTDGQGGLFFSEYAEGSGNNKYLEIYNGTESDVDLTGLALANVGNSPTYEGQYEYWNTFPDGAYVSAGDVYVIAHPEADEAILYHADHTFQYLSNGDDGYCLVEGTEQSYTILDCIGDWYGDPGDGWDVAGVEAGTKDHTLVRKDYVQQGNGGDWYMSAGTDPMNSEWIVLEQNDWTFLGSHPHFTDEPEDGNVLSIVFDGQDDFIDFSDGIISGIYSFTYESWINVSSFENWQRIADFGTGAGNNLFITPNPGTNPYPSFVLNDGSGEQQVNSSISIDPDQWYHLAVTLNDDNHAKMYINGELVGENTNMTQRPADIGNGNTTNNWIGRSQYGGDAYFHGYIDEVRIWDFDRTQEDIQNTMHSQLSGNEDGLRSYWNFNHGDGDMVHDLAGDDFNGTLINGADWSSYVPELEGSFSCNENIEGFTYIGSRGNSCYYISEDAMVWTDASVMAQSYGGHLATITSQEEQDFLGNYGGWIGLTDENVEGQWEWVTGEPVNYTNWIDGEPNDAGNGEDYVERFEYGWNDHEETHMMPFFMEISGGTNNFGVEETLSYGSEDSDSWGTFSQFPGDAMLMAYQVPADGYITDLNIPIGGGDQSMIARVSLHRLSYPYNEFGENYPDDVVDSDGWIGGYDMDSEGNLYITGNEYTPGGTPTPCSDMTVNDGARDPLSTDSFEIPSNGGTVQTGLFWQGAYIDGSNTEIGATENILNISDWGDQPMVYKDEWIGILVEMIEGDWMSFYATTVNQIDQYPFLKFYGNGTCNGTSGNGGWHIRSWIMKWDVGMLLTGDRGPMVHDFEVLNTNTETGDRHVWAEITDDNPSGGNSGVAFAELVYSSSLDDGDTWHSIPMENTFENRYEAHVPGFPPGTDVWYYIYAEDNNGNWTDGPTVSYKVFEQERPYLFVYNTDEYDDWIMDFYLFNSSSYEDFDFWSGPYYGDLNQEILEGYDLVVEVSGTQGPWIMTENVIRDWLNTGDRSYIVAGADYLWWMTDGSEDELPEGSFIRDILGVRQPVHDIAYWNNGYGEAISRIVPSGHGISGDLASFISDSLVLNYDPDYELGEPNWIDGIIRSDNSEPASFSGYSGPVDNNGNVSEDADFFDMSSYVELDNGSRAMFLSFDPLATNTSSVGADPYNHDDGYYWTGVMSIGPLQSAIDEMLNLNMTFGIDQTSALPGETVSVSVWAEVPEDHPMYSYEISVIGFGGDMMNIVSVDTIGSITPSDWIFSYSNDDENGMVITAGAGSQGVSGSGNLFNLHFSLSSSMEGGNFIDLFLVDPLINENHDMDYDIENGGVLVLTYGDVSTNGDVTPFDASLILQYLAGSIELDNAQIGVGDVTQDATLSALDAAKILDYSVGLINSLPVEHDHIEIPQGFIDISGGSYAPGDIISMPITLESGDNVRSFEVDLSYDPEVLVFNSIQWNNDVSTMTIMDLHDEGVFRASAAGIGSINSGSIVLGNIEFELLDSFTDQQTIVTMSRSRLNEETALVDEVSAVFTNALLVVDEWGHGGVPDIFALKQNYPNPFNPTTRIRYQLPKESMVSVKIYDIMGRVVKELVPKQKKLAGFYQSTWNATNNNGDQVGAGMYIYVIEADNFRDSHKMVLMK